MHKHLVIITLCLPLFTYAMDDTQSGIYETLSQLLDYSTNEEDRTFLQQSVRSVRKWCTESGGRDLVGLGSAPERTRTLEIYKKIKTETHDEATIHQFLERQQKATKIALALTNELKTAKLIMSDRESHARILLLILDARTLRELNDEYALPPVISSQLKTATDTVISNNPTILQSLTQSSEKKEDQSE